MPDHVHFFCACDETITRLLRRPASRWACIPGGAVLIIGDCLGIRPFFGSWMLPPPRLAAA
jgi:hypothetical protein